MKYTVFVASSTDLIYGRLSVSHLDCVELFLRAFKPPPKEGADTAPCATGQNGGSSGGLGRYLSKNSSSSRVSCISGISPVRPLSTAKCCSVMSLERMFPICPRSATWFSIGIRMYACSLRILRIWRTGFRCSSVVKEALTGKFPQDQNSQLLQLPSRQL